MAAGSVIRDPSKGARHITEIHHAPGVAFPSLAPQFTTYSASLKIGREEAIIMIIITNIGSVKEQS